MGDELYIRDRYKSDLKSQTENQQKHDTLSAGKRLLMASEGTWDGTDKTILWTVQAASCEKNSVDVPKAREGAHNHCTTLRTVAV